MEIQNYQEILDKMIVYIYIFLIYYYIHLITFDHTKFIIINNYFINNWSNSFIKKIKIEYKNNILDKDYEWESLINASFPDIYSICNCTSYNDENCETSLFKNLKNFNNIKMGNYYSIYLPEIDIYSGKRFEIEIERYKDINYIKLLNNSKDNKDYFIDNNFENCKCPKNTEICFDCGIIDSIGNHLCITSYAGLNNNCYKLQLEYDYTLKDLNLIKNFEKIFNKSNNNRVDYLQYPIEFINIFDNETCFYQKEILTMPTIFYKLNYNNNKYINQSCDTKLLFNIKYDKRWINAFFFPVSYLLDNELKRKIKLFPQPIYDEFINNTLTIAYRTYIGIGKHCINDIQYFSEDFPSFMKSIILIKLSIFISINIIFPAICINYLIIFKTLKYIQTLVYLGCFSGLISIFLHNLFLGYNDIEQKYLSLNIIANKYCGDDLTNSLFFSILNDYENFQNYNRYVIYFISIIFCISLVKFILAIVEYYQNLITYTLFNNLFTSDENHLLN